MMGSQFGDWPSNNPQHISQFRPSDPTTPKMPPPTYLATHDKTLPPPDQVITSECIIDFLRRMSLEDAEKKLKSEMDQETFLPEHGSNQPKGSVISVSDNS